MQLLRGTTLLDFSGSAKAGGLDAGLLALDDVSLTFLRSRLRPIDLRDLVLTSNERAVGVALEASAQPNSESKSLVRALGKLSINQIPAALDSLSGEGIAATQNLANRSSQLFTSSIFDQTTFYGPDEAGNSITLTSPTPGFKALAPEQTLAAAQQGQPIRELADLPASRVPPVFVAPQRTWRAWATGFGGTEDIHGNAVIGSARQDNTLYGGALGVDYQVTPNYLAGIAIGGTNGDFQVGNRGTFGSTSGGHIAFYDIATFGNFYGASSNSFSYHTNRSTRSVAGFGGLASETERGDFNSDEFRTRLEFGRHFVGSGLAGLGGTITPFVALEIAELRSNGFAEQAVSGPGLFRLNVDGQTAADVPGFVGARYQSLMAFGNGMTLSTFAAARLRARVRALPPADEHHCRSARRHLPRRWRAAVTQCRAGQGRRRDRHRPALGALRQFRRRVLRRRPAICRQGRLQIRLVSGRIADDRLPHSSGEEQPVSPRPVRDIRSGRILRFKPLGRHLHLKRSNSGSLDVSNS